MAKKDLVFLNYASAESILSVDSVPTLVPDAKMASIMDGDGSPYFKIESINYPVRGNGANYEEAIYQESFFESFLNVMKDRPIPGSKRGHTWDSRPTSDLYTVGGRIDSNGDGTGTVHMKVYIPRHGDSDSNAGLIRDAKANIVHFSLVTLPEFETVIGEDGNVVAHVTASRGYERNDAVEYGAGAMRQTVNSRAFNGVMSRSVSNARRLIESGDYDESSSWSFSALDGNDLLGGTGDDWENYALWHLYEDTEASPQTKDRYKYPYGKNGKVFRSALRAIASRAAQQGLTDLSDTASGLIDLIDGQRSRSSKKGVRKVETKKEAIELLANMRQNGDVTLMEIAKGIGLEGQVMTEEARNSMAVIDEFKKLGITDPVASYNSMKASVDKTEADRVESRLRNEFDKSGLGDENLLFVHAKSVLGNKKESELDEAIKAFNEDPVARKLAAELADVTSDANDITALDGVPAKNQKLGESAVLKL